MSKTRIDTVDIQIEDRLVGESHPAYFIADIAANHDGELSRAVDLIHLAAEAGADAAKFQHFQASRIVSREGFDRLANRLSHQAKWGRSVYDVYESASIPKEWTETLARACHEAGIHFFSAPYDMQSVDLLDPHVNVYKIGSGDIDWFESLEYIARKGKPVLLSTGASTMEEVTRAVACVTAINKQLLLMQCNTNYTASLENFKHVHLNVLKTYRRAFPGLVLGLSDHTPGDVTVLGAVTLGARAIEKHFTDDRRRTGPDHAFSMQPDAWKLMVQRTRALESALGSADKFLAENEKETVVVQRRCIRAARDLKAGANLDRGDLELLRPAPHDAIPPSQLNVVVGSTLLRDLRKGDAFYTDCIR